MVNVGNVHEVTIEQLAQMVKERTKSSSPSNLFPMTRPMKPGFEDMFRRVPNLEKLERLTGFSPRTMLPEIIDRVIDYQRRESRIVCAQRGMAVSAV